MNNSEKKYDSLGYILAAAMLAALINKDFSTSDTNPDESKNKPVKDDNTCNGNCKNHCKSCGESNPEIDMELVKACCFSLSNYFYSEINDTFIRTGHIPKKLLYGSNANESLQKALGIIKGK